MKYLLLENDSVIDTHGILYRKLKRLLENSENSLVEMPRASSRTPEEISKAILECDEVWFQTTFLRSNELYGLARMLCRMPTKTIRIYPMASRDIATEIESLLGDKVYDADHHIVYEVPQGTYDEEDTLVNLKQFRIARDLKEMERKNHLDGLLPTGNKVIIGKFGYNPGPEWSVLKEGDIVDEIERPKDDPNIYRGIWVRGLTEPVKLLNEAPYTEFTFETMSADALAVEFFSMSHREGDEARELLMWRINGMDDTTNINDFSTEICDYLGIERRHNRAIIQGQLTKYREKYTFFKEKNPLDRYKNDHRKKN